MSLDREAQLLPLGPPRVARRSLGCALRRGHDARAPDWDVWCLFSHILYTTIGLSGATPDSHNTEAVTTGQLAREVGSSNAAHWRAARTRRRRHDARAREGTGAATNNQRPRNKYSSGKCAPRPARRVITWSGDCVKIGTDAARRWRDIVHVNTTHAVILPPCPRPSGPRLGAGGAQRTCAIFLAFSRRRSRLRAVSYLVCALYRVVICLALCRSARSGDWTLVFYLLIKPRRS